MCVTFDKSHMQRTELFVGKALHPDTEHVVHTLVYKNLVENNAEGGNAMILHLPTDSVGRENFIDLQQCPNILKDMGWTDDVMLSASDEDQPKVYSSGSYSVVLARRAGTISDVLDQVPQERRPKVNQTLLNWYDETFQGGWFLLACFGGERAMDAEPFGVWYEPWNLDKLVVPLVDSHDGTPPKLGATVERDHTIYLGDSSQDDALDKLPNQGSDTQRGVISCEGYFKEVRYTDELSPLHRCLFPKYVRKAFLGREGVNGDLIVDLENWDSRVGLVTKAGTRFFE